jgi:hypothetical protein
MVCISTAQEAVGAKEEIGKQGGREGFYMAPPQKEKQKAP